MTLVTLGQSLYSGWVQQNWYRITKPQKNEQGLILNGLKYSNIIAPHGAWNNGLQYTRVRLVPVKPSSQITPRFRSTWALLLFQISSFIYMSLARKRPLYMWHPLSKSWSTLINSLFQIACTSCKEKINGSS